MTRNGLVYELPTPEHHTAGSGCSSLPRLNTPTVEDAGRDGSPEWAARWAAGEPVPTTQQRLRTQILTLPTPRASRGAPGTETMYRLGGERSDQARSQGMVILPTPRTTDMNGPGAHGDGGQDLRTTISLLPTPTTQGAANLGGPSQFNRNSLPLNTLVMTLGEDK